MIANDLVLTKYQPKNGTGIPTNFNDFSESLKSISLEIHRRFEKKRETDRERERERERERAREREREREREGEESSHDLPPTPGMV